MQLQRLKRFIHTHPFLFYFSNLSKLLLEFCLLWDYTIRIKGITEKDRNTIIKEMHDKGIGADGYYPTPVHQMPFYKENFGI